MQTLISLPLPMAVRFAGLGGRVEPGWFAASDPPDRRLGSGGGTVHLLREAWRSGDPAATHPETWRNREKRLILHSGGQSRRLPAYAPCGKGLVPVPVFRWSRGQRIDQTLLDLQVELPSLLLAASSPAQRWLVASGDVLIRCEAELPDLPDVDVLCLGLWADPEQATRHGVFFLSRRAPEILDFMLQKPGLDRIRELAETHFFLLDIGIWLLSDRAMDVLFRKTGCDPETWNPAGEHPAEYDLYGQFGPSLGSNPSERDREISALTSAVLPLPGGEFYHFGSNRDLIASAMALQNRTLDQRRIFGGLVKPHPSIFVQNSKCERTFDSGTRNVWVENSHLAAGWMLHSDHVLTGVPGNDWNLELASGRCLDFVPIGPDEFAIRVYGIDDAFRGPVGDPATRWLGCAFHDWLNRRGIAFEDVALDPSVDIQQAAIFPVVGSGDLEESFVAWLTADKPSGDARHRARFLGSRRLSADGLSGCANLDRLFESRRKRLDESLPVLAKNASRSVFYQVDLRHLAGRFAAAGHALPDPRTLTEISGPGDLSAIHDRMFRAVVAEASGRDGSADEEAAFDILRRAVLAGPRANPVRPEHNVLPDQLIWGRSPARLDLAGGWTDTPPFCFIQGGRVLNVAVELNGQPPIQVFARMTPELRLRIRSIDLGQNECLESYSDVGGFAQVGSGFSIAKAAFALAGFHPDYFRGAPFASLRDQLEDFGGGIEISLVAAVPKGSGLGTSSILAATILGVLNDLCQLGWDRGEIGRRTLALEQMLTSGGGWQDQFGALIHGIKLLETGPGLDQAPRVRWLPDGLLSDPVHHSKLLLYYTGITRHAKNLLSNIVRGMFLNSQPELGLLSRIGSNALAMADALESGSWDSFCGCLETSWNLNQSLDSGTNPPALAETIDRIGRDAGGLKLLGAGGGGYLLIAAKSADAASRIATELARCPTAPGARFVNFTVSKSGFQVTRS